MADNSTVRTAPTVFFLCPLQCNEDQSVLKQEVQLDRERVSSHKSCFHLDIQFWSVEGQASPFSFIVSNTHIINGCFNMRWVFSTFHRYQSMQFVLWITVRQAETIICQVKVFIHTMINWRIFLNSSSICSELQGIPSFRDISRTRWSPVSTRFFI